MTNKTRILNFITKNIILLLIIALANCTSKKDKDVNVFGIKGTYAGHYKVGDPYKINGQWYFPKEVKNHTEFGIASWYGGKDGFHGKKTANGDRYNKRALTAAHRTLPLPSVIRVTNTKNNKSVVLMVNDRGPFAKKRVIDVSERAAEILQMKQSGHTHVKVELLENKTKELLASLGLTPKNGATSKVSANTKQLSANAYLEAENRLPQENVISKTSLVSHKTNKSVFINVGVYKHKANAINAMRELSSYGKTHIKPVSTNNKTLYQVHIGPLKNHHSAKNILSELIDQGNNKAVILEHKDL